MSWPLYSWTPKWATEWLKKENSFISTGWLSYPIHCCEAPLTWLPFGWYLHWVQISLYSLSLLNQVPQNRVRQRFIYVWFIFQALSENLIREWEKQSREGKRNKQERGFRWSPATFWSHRALWRVNCTTKCVPPWAKGFCISTSVSHWLWAARTEKQHNSQAPLGKITLAVQGQSSWESCKYEALPDHPLRSEICIQIKH